MATSTSADYEVRKSLHIAKVKTVASGSMSTDSESIRSPPIEYTRPTSLRHDIFLTQSELYQALEHICTAAAGKSWRCQTRSAHDRPHVLCSSTNPHANFAASIPTLEVLSLP